MNTPLYGYGETCSQRILCSDRGSPAVIQGQWGGGRPLVLELEGMFEGISGSVAAEIVDEVKDICVE